MTTYYRLVGKIAVKEDDLVEWERWLHTLPFCVRLTTIDADCAVDTVFFGLDRNRSGEGPPILFGTTVFGGKHDGFGQRYSTWEEAEEGHEAIVELVKGGES